jgi:hypothetical protein
LLACFLSLGQCMQEHYLGGGMEQVEMMQELLQTLIRAEELRRMLGISDDACAIKGLYPPERREEFGMALQAMYKRTPKKAG